MSGTTALYVALPEVAPVVRRAGGWTRPRLLHRPQPPHVTVLWPYLPPDALDSNTRRELAATFAQVPAFTARFTKVRHFPAVTYLAPDDPEPFVHLTRTVVARWPQCPPYAGEFEEVIPHVTLRWAPALEPSTRLDDLLPVVVDVRAVHLAVDRRWRGWTPVAVFPLSST